MTAPSASGAFRVDHHISTAAELLRRNRIAEAKDELEGALAIDGESVRAQALYGLALFRGGSFEQARPIYEKLVLIAPDDAAYHLNLGLVRLKLGDADGAVVALERSRDLDPSQGRAVNYLGLAYARGGRFPEAYRAFLVAGQSDLAREIADNLSAAERTTIEGSLRRPAAGGSTPPKAEPPAPPRPAAPPPPPEPTVTPISATAAAADEDDVSGDLVLSIEAEPGASGALPSQSPVQALAAAVDVDLDDSFPAASVSGRFVTGEMAGELDSPDADLAVARLGEPMSEREPEPPPAPPAARAPAPMARPLRAATAPLQRPVESSPALIIDNQGAISRAVADAAPSTAGAPTNRAAAGARGPQPLSEFATARLVRPEDGDQPFELSAGGFLIVRVADKMYSRTEGVDVTGGSLTYEPAHRRARGQSRGEPFATAGRPMFQVTGKGHLIAAPLGGQFTAVALDEDIFYLREDLLFAFEPVLRWENGHVPGSRATIPMVQFRGTGAIAFRTTRPLLTVKLAADKVLYVDASALAGWIGRVVPRAVTAADAGGAAELFVECSGEGVVLVEEPAPLP